MDKAQGSSWVPIPDRSVAIPTESQSILQLRLHLFGKIGLFGGVIGVMAMLLIGFKLMPVSAGDYRQSLAAFQLSADNLPWVLVLAGGALAALSGLITWLISLYGSFRVAGPIYRFSRNLEQLSQVGPVRLQPIRQNDCLHAESLALQGAADALRRHYLELDQALAVLERRLDDEAGLDRDQLQALLKQLAEVSHSARC